MRSSQPDASDLRVSPLAPGAAPLEWRRNLWLFLATVVSVFVTGLFNDGAPPRSHEAILHATQFTVSLLTILLAHEFGHYIAARIHKVDASLPFFIPLPMLSPFGTMGAVIRMRGTIGSRKALFDIGAAGPLAGLFFAIPMYFWGVSHSQIVPIEGVGGDSVQLGESVLLRLLDHFAAVQVPDGMDVRLSPIAFAAWAGMFVTMINLLPVGQLDGGHVAFSLFGKRQDKAALVVHRSMLAFFFVSLFGYLARDVRAGIGLHRIGTHVNNSLFWLVWFEVLAVLGVVSSRAKEVSTGANAAPLPISTRIGATLALALVAGFGREHPIPTLWIAWFIGLGLLLAMEARDGVLKKHALFDHPPAGDVRLGPFRTFLAVVTLAFFVLLFMPTPISM